MPRNGVTAALCCRKTQIVRSGRTFLVTSFTCLIVRRPKPLVKQM